MHERHQIYRRRAVGQAWPWTTDPVLQRYHFCNVYRELDAVTVWIRTHIREPYADSPHLWFHLLAARFFNDPATLEVVKGLLPRGGTSGYEPTALVTVLRARAAQGHRTFRPAYMVRSRTGLPKITYVAAVLQGAWERRAVITSQLRATLGGAVAALSSLYGLGGFMAYEVATDLRHCPGWLAGAPDVNTYAHVGPGAVRGLHRLAGRPLQASLGQATALAETQALLPTVQAAWPAGGPPLELRDIEHSLCEYDKYERARSTEHAFSLRRYRPPGVTAAAEESTCV